MASQAIATHGVMEGGGSYNLHAQIPADGGNLALPFLEEAARNMPLEEGDQSSGYSRLRILSRKKLARSDADGDQGLAGPSWPGSSHLVSCTSIRRQTISTRSSKYFTATRNAIPLTIRTYFPSAIGRSFYERVFPNGHVHLGWSSYAAVWLNRIPMAIPGHFVALASTGEVREAFERQADEDWNFFLSLRAASCGLADAWWLCFPASTMKVSRI